MDQATPSPASVAIHMVVGALLASAPPSFADVCQVQHVVDPHPGRWNSFGATVRIERDLLAVGASGTWFNSIEESGVVHLYEWRGDQWVQRESIGAPDGAPYAAFGGSISLNQGRLLIGANWRESSWGNIGGAAYLFERINSTWQTKAEFFSPAGPEAAYFGVTLALDGDQAMIGSSDTINGLQYCGAVYVYERQGAEWVNTQRLTASDAAARDYFGFGLARSGDLLVVGSSYDDDQGDASGAAYVFEKIQGSWIELAKLRPSDGVAGDAFGRSVTIDPDGTIFVAAPAKEVNGATHTGVLYVFERQESNWVEVQKIEGPDGGQFGGSQRHGDLLIVGASRANQHLGRVYLYEKVIDDWELVGTIDGSDGVHFGGSLTAQDDMLIVGAAGTLDIDGYCDVFDLECGEFAMLNSISVAFGQHIGGGLNRILESDDLYYRARSNPGFTATEPNLIELRINATSNIINASTLDLILEGRISQPGGSARVRLRDWNAGPNQFQTVHTYLLGMSEATEFIENVPDAQNYIRASDGRMQLSLRQSVFATFSALGFESFLDFVSIEVEE